MNRNQQNSRFTKINEKLTERLLRFMEPALEGVSQDIRDTVEYLIGLNCRSILSGLVLLLIAAQFGNGLPMLLVIGAFSILKMFTFGIHFKNAMHCSLWGTGQYIAILLLAKNLNLPDTAYILAFTALLAIYWVYAPCGSEVRPVGANEKKNNRRIALCILMGYILFCNILNNVLVTNLVLYSAMAQAVNILPVTFRLFGMRHHVQYKPEESIMDSDPDVLNQFVKDSVQRLGIMIKEQNGYRRIAQLAPMALVICLLAVSMIQGVEAPCYPPYLNHLPAKTPKLLQQKWR